MTLAAWRFVPLLLLGFLLSSPAQAYRFGTDESITKIQDVTLKGPDDEALFLGHMTRTRWFLAGLYVEDAGYVLGVEGPGKRYFTMPTGEALAGFQRNGVLPSPLPGYSISAFDYIFGYSLWWALALGAALVWFGDRKKRQAAAQAAMSAAPEPGPPGVVAQAASPPPPLAPLPPAPLPPVSPPPVPRA